MSRGLPSLDPAQSGEYPGLGFFAVTDHSPQLLKGDLIRVERWGFDVPSADEARAPGWGIGPASTELDDRNQYSQPFSSSESIRRFDFQRCIDVLASTVVQAGVAFELVHMRNPSGSVVVLEEIPMMFDDITALDDAGVPIFSYGSVNGERLCRSELVHPDPLVLIPLTWRFAITYSDDPSQTPNTADLAYEGPIAPAAIRGQHITPPWTDIRYGANNSWADTQQWYSPSATVTRYWVVLAGPTDRFRVRVGARLGGFWQAGGRRSAALDSVLTRRL